MNIRVHISRSEMDSHTQSKRVWLLTDDICQKCVLLLGGNPKDPNSIAIRKGYRTQSQMTVPMSKLLKGLGRKYIEVPEGKKIHYRRALVCGYEYIFSQIDGAWTFDSVSDILLNGYTGEKTCPDNGHVQSIGPLRQTVNEQSDGGIRYLLKYIDETKKYADIYEVIEFERNPEEAQKQGKSSDELAEMIF